MGAVPGEQLVASGPDEELAGSGPDADLVESVPEELAGRSSDEDSGGDRQDRDPILKQLDNGAEDDTGRCWATPAPLTGMAVEHLGLGPGSPSQTYGGLSFSGVKNNRL